jgi:hypothetical protein
MATQSCHDEGENSDAGPEPGGKLRQDAPESELVRGSALYPAGSREVSDEESCRDCHRAEIGRKILAIQPP